MKVIAFVEGKPKPQPRLTQKVKFLFGNTVEHWMRVDAENAVKEAKGMLNKKGKPYKATRFAYRLDRLLKLNEYRSNMLKCVKKETGGNIPSQNLFMFYLFHCPKTWSKKKKKAHEWKFHVLKPDYSNILKGIEDALYESDSECNAVAHYKLYVPGEYKCGVLILQDEEIHNYVIESAIDIFKKLPVNGSCVHNSDKIQTS